MSKRTEGPWMVGMRRFEGNTYYSIMSHTHATVAVDRQSYWPDDYECVKDGDGYIQPDEQMDCEPHRVSNARLIAAAPELLEALDNAVEALDSDNPDIQLRAAVAARAVIAKAKGD